MSDAVWSILPGDCRATLATLTAGSVHTCVTSPPYFGLRDYGTGEWEGGDAACDHGAERRARRQAGRQTDLDGGTPGSLRDPMPNTCRCGARRVDRQIGLEPTPDEFVAALVDVFREVRRVLRDDGTVWLNLGSSYFTPNGGAGGSDPTPSRRPQRAPAYGIDGREPLGSPAPDSACPDLCDGCQAATQSHRARNADTLPPHGPGEQPPATTDRGSGRQDSEPAIPAASLPAAPASTTQRSSAPPPAECSHCSNCGACLSVLRSSSRDAQACARRAGSTSGSGSLGSESRSLGMDASGMAWVNYTRRLKPKDMVPTPWMVAMALQADGWYLRSDIIWSKSNPMPESVTDRPTKAHEYLFLLSKSAKYHYDADAIREPAEQPEGVAALTGQHKVLAEPIGRHGSSASTLGTNQGAPHRNKRSVWTVATQPFSGWTRTVRRTRVAADDADDDTKRTASPDCPVHASQDHPGPNPDHGGHGAAHPRRSPDTGVDRAPGQQLGFAPIDQPDEPLTADGSSSSSGQPCDPAATARSTESRRTDPDPATTPPCTPSAQTTSRTAGTSALLASAAPGANTLASSNGSVGSGDPPSAGTPAGTSDNASCTCEYYLETTEETSHFATFPPKLIEPCILAGCPEGGTVLDPFAGAGTTGMVALRHNRSFIGCELSPEYVALARDRIIADSPLLNTHAEAA